MANAVVCFNPEHDIAAIRWDRRPNDFPVDAVNRALEALYRNDDLAPYLYVVYGGDQTLGLLVASNFNPENDSEIRAVFNDIVNRDNIAPETTGDYARIEVQV
ncbi:MAG TPA: hypothetical protein VE990_04340 [Acidimicrobiales bacterium]|nr:hypothetical protein [Acidimicrobiales bacterium]